MGGKEGRSSETRTRRQESPCQKGGGEGGTGDEGCGQGCRPEGCTTEVRPGKGVESSGQEDSEEDCLGHGSTHRGGGINTDAVSRGDVGASFTGAPMDATLDAGCWSRAVRPRYHAAR